MKRIVVLDSGWGGEMVADLIEAELAIVEVVRVIDWRHAPYSRRRRSEMLSLAEAALAPYWGRTDVVVLGGYEVSLIAPMLQAKHPQQKFVALELDRFLARRHQPKRRVLLLSDPRLLRMAECDALVSALHARGIEVYSLLRDEYDIQAEFGDLGNLLAYISIGDRPREIERLIGALAEIRRRFKRDKAGLMKQEYIDPIVVVSPQEAFYADKVSLPLKQTAGRICSEFVMCYPPGIPILAPGEQITPQILDYIEYAKDKGCSMTGPEDADITRLNVLKGV